MVHHFEGADGDECHRALDKTFVIYPLRADDALLVLGDVHELCHHDARMAQEAVMDYEIHKPRLQQEMDAGCVGDGLERHANPKTVHSDDPAGF